MPNGTGYNYVYYLGDHLGNTQVTFETKTGAAVAIQKDDYYPFGMEINTSVTSLKNEYLYNKKELQEELGQYDYGARFYDPILGRWNVVDAYAEHPDQINLSLYVYVGNNPITRIDPDGNCSGPPCDVPIDPNVPYHSIFGSYEPGHPPSKNGGDNGIGTAGDRLSTGGMIVEGTGIVAAFVPGAEEFAPVLIEDGSNMTVAGTVISAGNDYANGDKTSAFIKLGTAAVFKTIDAR